MSGLGAKRWWALVAIVLSILTIGFDTTILNVALPTLATAIDAGTDQLQWIVNAYVLVFAGLLLPMGVLGDRYGRKRLLLLGLALFGGASLLAVFAQNAGQLIAARAVMGIGGAILTPVTMAVLPVLFEPEERGKAIAATTMGMGIGLPLGPIIGGLLLRHFWWGSVFLVNIPVAVIAFIAVCFLVPESRDPRPERVDLPGTLLSITGLTSFVYGVIEAPNRGWTDGWVLGTLALGVVLLGTFAVVERRVEAPMIDLRLFRRRRFAWGTASSTISSFSLFGLLFVLPLYLQAVRGHDALGVGVRLLPLIGGLFVGAPLSSRLVERIGSKIPVAAGLTIAAAGLAMGAGTGTGSGYGYVAAWLAIAGLGVGVALTPAMDAVMGELPRERAGSGTAVTMTVRQVAGALGVALLGSIASAVYQNRLDTGALPAPAAKIAEDSVAGGMKVAQQLGDGGLAQAAGSAYLHGMSVVLLVCASLALLGAVLVTAFLPARPSAPKLAEQASDAEQSVHELAGTA
jgi:EmrB/QacA subfamily drug resistance transporter